MPKFGAIFAFFVPLKSPHFPQKGQKMLFSLWKGRKCRQQIGLKAIWHFYDSTSAHLEFYGLCSWWSGLPWYPCTIAGHSPLWGTSRWPQPPNFSQKYCVYYCNTNGGAYCDTNGRSTDSISLSSEHRGAKSTAIQMGGILQYKLEVYCDTFLRSCGGWGFWYSLDFDCQGALISNHRDRRWRSNSRRARWWTVF